MTLSRLRRRLRRLLHRLRLRRPRGLRLFERVDPRLRLLRSFRHRRRVELGHEIVERDVGLAAGARDQVPFHGADRIARGTQAAGENAREAVLGDRAAVLRGLAEDRGGGVFVAGNAVAVIERDGVFDLRVGVVGKGCRRPQRHRFVHVFAARRGRPCRRCRARIAPAGCRRRRRRAEARRRA